jgi:hypothetical protein
MIYGTGDLNFDDVLASQPLWTGSPAQKRIATAAAAQAFFQSPAAVHDPEWLVWLRKNQKLVLWIAGGLVAFALLRPGGRR